MNFNRAIFAGDGARQRAEIHAKKYNLRVFHADSGYRVLCDDLTETLAQPVYLVQKKGPSKQKSTVKNFVAEWFF